MIFWLLVTALSVIVLFPDTPTAKTLRHILVDEPARLIRETTPRKLAVGLLVGLLLVVAAVVAPEFLALVMSMGDVTLAIELLAAFALLSFNRSVLGTLKRVTGLAKRAASGARTLLLAGRRAAQRQRGRRTRTDKRPPSSDDAGPPAWADAAFA
jgi:hypothetical protein